MCPTCAELNSPEPLKCSREGCTHARLSWSTYCGESCYLAAVPESEDIEFFKAEWAAMRARQPKRYDLRGAEITEEARAKFREIDERSRLAAGG